MERFSPLHIESTLRLIRDEFSSGNDKLGEGLMQRLQFPLTLGSFKKQLEVCQEYSERLLSSRMLKNDPEKAKKIGKELTTGYADHSWCITIEEAVEIGLNATEVEGDCLDVVWQIHRLHKEKEELISAEEKQKTREKMKDLPLDLQDILPPDAAEDGGQTNGTE